jgi:phosphate binding protein
MLNKLKLQAKILLTILFTSLVAAGIVGIISLTLATKTLKEESFNKLTAIREMKANQIETYFQQIFDQVLSFSESRSVIDATVAFRHGFYELQSEMNYTRQELVHLDSTLSEYYQNQFIEKLFNRDSSINYFSIPKEELIQSKQHWLSIVYEDSASNYSDGSFPRLNPSDFSGQINMSGSSTVSSLAERIIELFGNEGAMGAIQYKVTGTSEGLIQMVEDSNVDLVGSSHSLDSMEHAMFEKKGLRPLTFRIGTDALVVVVSDQNDFIQSMSLEELREVFTSASTWSEINPDWPNQEIRKFIPSVGSGSYNLFTKLILDGKDEVLENSPNTTIIKDGSRMKEAMKADPSTIAFFSYNYFDREARQRVLQIDGVKLSNQSIRNRLYPLSRPLYLVTTEEKLKARPDIGQFINFTLHTIGSSVGVDLESKDFWPEHSNHRILQSQYIASNPFGLGERDEYMTTRINNKYDKSHGLFHPIFKNYQDRFGYYDIFLITADSGHIIYSVSKEVDFATDIVHGPFRNTGIARVYNKVINCQEDNCVFLEDFSPYLPSYNAPSAFIASAIYRGNEKIGVLVFQLPIGRINHIMTNGYDWENVGLGKTGETYLVGDDYLIRNQSRFLIENPNHYYQALEYSNLSNEVISGIKALQSSIGLQPVITLGTRAAISGMSGTEIFKDYRGVKVLSSYKPLKVDQVDWVIMSEIDRSEAYQAITLTVKRFSFWFLVLLVVVVAMSVLLARSISRPIQLLSQRTSDFAKGNLDVPVEIRQSDEIGLLATNFERMRRSIKVLISDLNEANRDLKQKVKNRTRKIEQQSINITDSIQYASRIQRALMTPSEEINRLLPSYFILNKPKDIVSGDYYWVSNSGSRVIVAVADCTGHGVPGAFMSILGISFLNEIVNKSEEVIASKILNELRENLIKSLRQTGEGDESKDGMEMAICVVDFDQKKVQFSGAFRPMYLIRNWELQEIKGDRMPIGLYDNELVSFSDKELQFLEEDIIYLFSDGYVDQIGGPNRKTFRAKNFKQLLLSIHMKTMDEQKATLEHAFEQWKSDAEQIDDIMVMGIKFAAKSPG